ncbi:hypothetical protein KC19_8G174600 [Ceratodon purpureus]|uniref:Uncharacterized protein n=1 Tax=Ceratodon purpureus TaxID=3225 RepID=A0A8T0H1J9_CERPU|nr:hypothetical protein KC19_8G174600 [Ceratodon purpureus]
MHRLGEYSLRPYSYGAPHLMDQYRAQPESSHVVPMEVHQDVYYTNLCHSAYSSGDPYNGSSSNSALLSANATYTNFFNQGCRSDNDSINRRQPELQSQYVPSTDNHYSYNSSVPPSNATSPRNHYAYSSSVNTLGTLVPGENINRDMESLRQELAYKCPRSDDLLMAITKTAEATVQEHGTADEDDDNPRPPQLFPLSELEQDQELRASIIDHPYYPEMVVAHIKIFMIGAPKELRKKLDDIITKFQGLQVNTTTIGDDPSLDFLMRSYVNLLGKLCDDIEEPFNKFMEFKDASTKQLEDICGHFVATEPDESDNYGYDICSGQIDAALEMENLERMQEDQNMMYPLYDIDESIFIDASMPDDELKKKLMQKYGRHIGGLKAEFSRVRKKGKLPALARTILKDWFNRHSYWPYPSELEKSHLQRLCDLNLKQINNWFINERKRHWSCEGKCMHPNAKYYNSAAGKGGDKGNM